MSDTSKLYAIGAAALARDKLRYIAIVCHPKALNSTSSSSNAPVVGATTPSYADTLFCFRGHIDKLKLATSLDEMPVVLFTIIVSI